MGDNWSPAPKGQSPVREARGYKFLIRKDRPLRDRTIHPAYAPSGEFRNDWSAVGLWCALVVGQNDLCLTLPTISED